MNDPSKALRRGRRGCEGIPGVDLRGTFGRHGSKWAFAFTVDVGDTKSEFVPRHTEWFVVAGDHYPEGAIDVFPARQGGISATFPHQRPNLVDEALPWRSGKLCLDDPTARFGRATQEREPIGDADRLRWHLERAACWANAAARGTLTADGEHFELPALPTTLPGWTVVFREDTGSFETWLASDADAGALSWAQRGPLIVPLAFSAGKRIVLSLDWGTWGECLTEAGRSPWVLLPELPVLRPWQAPGTWGDLRKAVARSQIDLDDILRTTMELLRSSSQPMLFFGAPIPKRFGHEVSEIHWQAVLAPRLKPRRKRGARLWKLDKKEFLPAEPLHWLRTTNAADGRMRARGAMTKGSRRLKYLLLGTGALGTLVGELLVREGCSQLTVVDPDSLAAGNLARHSLTVEQVGLNKAKAVATRLAAVSPGASVRAIPEGLSNENVDRLVAESEVIIDTTGDDDVLACLARHDGADEKCWFSGWVSYGVDHLFVFSAKAPGFPLSSFRAQTDELMRQADPISAQPEIREGAGCWDVCFPGRASDFYAFAGAMLRIIDARLDRQLAESEVIVLERTVDERGVPTIGKMASRDSAALE